MDLRVVHPIPLTVADVMSKFHVLDALRNGQGGGSNRPANLAPAATDDEACGEVDASLKRDGAPDICPVLGTARILDVATDRLQLGRKGLDVRIAEMGILGYVCDGHRRLKNIQARWRAALLAG